MSTANNFEKLFTTEEVAEILGLTEPTICAWIRRGRLRAVNLGRTYRIPRSEVERLLKENETPTSLNRPR